MRAETELQKFYGIPQNIIDRNIQPFAKFEFENLLKIFGNIRASKIIRCILSLELHNLTEDELENTAALRQAFYGPNNSLFQSPLTFKNNFARAYFGLILLRCMSDHLKELKANKHEDASLLMWIPSRVKQYVAIIKNEIVLKNNQPKYDNTKSAIYTAFGLCLVYNQLLSKDDSEGKIFRFICLTIASLIIIGILSDKFFQKFDLYCSKKQDQSIFGNVFVKICDLIFEIENDQLEGDKIEDKITEYPVNLLFRRNGKL